MQHKKLPTDFPRLGAFFHHSNTAIFQICTPPSQGGGAFFAEVILREQRFRRALLCSAAAGAGWDRYDLLFKDPVGRPRGYHRGKVEAVGLVAFQLSVVVNVGVPYLNHIVVEHLFQQQIVSAPGPVALGLDADHHIARHSKVFFFR